MIFDEIVALRLKLLKVFTPGAPINSIDLFAGRVLQITSLNLAIQQPGRHVILFGERGVGKTSLARVVADIKSSDGYHMMETVTMNCDESDNFSSLWHKIFSALPYDEVDGETRYIDYLMGEVISPDDVRHALSRYREPTLVIIDEVDQLKNDEAKSLLTATLKNLSDHSVNTTLILIGVADTVNELIVERKSAERSLIQVRMPRMSPDELAEIIDRGLEVLGMTIDPYAKGIILGLSRRLPFYTHSFGLYSGLKAIEKGRKEIIPNDVMLATLDVVRNAFNVRTAYYEATSSNQSSNRYEDALLACALSQTNELGFFPAVEMGKWFSALSEKEYKASGYVRYLDEFVTGKREVLQRAGEKRRYLYRFKDPLMQPFVLINAFGRDKLSDNLLSQIISEARVSQPVDEDLPF